MSYRFQRDESVEEGVRRIAREQMDKIMSELDAAGENLDDAVHSIRKRCKKLRALLRIVRPGFEDIYRRENAVLRDGARRLSAVRDAKALVECFDVLIERYRESLKGETLAVWREALEAERRELAEDGEEMTRQLSAFRQDMTALGERIGKWELDIKGFDALTGGLRKTYERGVRGMKIAYDEPSTETFHEWRKRVKYHRYQVRLMRSVWKPVMRARRKAMHDLSTYLGDEHDLAVLRDHLENVTAKRVGDDKAREALFGVIAQHRKELQKKARPLGKKAFAEKPKHHARRLGAYWKVWHRG